MHLLLTVSVIAWLSNWLLRLLFAVMVIAFAVCCHGYCGFFYTFLTVAFAVCCLVYCVCCWQSQLLRGCQKLVIAFAVGCLDFTLLDADCLDFITFLLTQNCEPGFSFSFDDLLF